jgi:predicted enzyme related to lactoylglutathione lyase
MLRKAHDAVPVQNGINIYINAGSDLNLVLNKVEGAGGKVVRPKAPITETSAWATFVDPEGNLVGLFESK